MTIYKRPNSPHLWCRFQLRGREYRQSTGTSSKRAAEAFERQWRADLERELAYSAGLIPQLSVLRNWDTTRARLSGRSEDYIATCIHKQYKTLAAFFRDAAEVTENGLAAYVIKRREDGVKAQTIKKELTVLKRGMLRAQREYSVPMPDYWPRLEDDPKDPRTSGQFFGDDIFKWFRCLKGKGREQAVAIVLTGLRLHELRRVRAEFISEHREAYPLLTLPARATKSKRDRIIALSRPAVHALSHAPFTTNYASAWETAARRAGLPNEVSARDLRKTFATIADGAGDPRGTDMIMGHSTGEVAMRYQHLSRERILKIARHVEAWFLEGMSKVGTQDGKHE